MASASGYQMVVSVGEAKQIKDMAITSLQVLIMGSISVSEQLHAYPSPNQTVTLSYYNVLR